MTVVRTPQIGDLGLVDLGGFTGNAIRVMQLLNGSSRTDARWEHVMVCLGPDHAFEARPGGAGYVQPSVAYSGRPVKWVRPLPQSLTLDEQEKLQHIAYELYGTKYSFLDYDALLLHRFGMNTSWVRTRVTDTGHMICSQLAAEMYERLGYDIAKPVKAEEWPGYVTPADLSKWYGDPEA